MVMNRLCLPNLLVVSFLFRYHISSRKLAWMRSYWRTIYQTSRAERCEIIRYRVWIGWSPSSITASTAFYQTRWDLGRPSKRSLSSAISSTIDHSPDLILSSSPNPLSTIGIENSIFGCLVSTSSPWKATRKNVLRFVNLRSWLKILMSSWPPMNFVWGKKEASRGSLGNISSLMKLIGSRM